MAEAEGQGEKKRWQRGNRFWSGVGTVFSTVFRNLSGVRGLTGIFAVTALVATAVASWWYTESAFGKFSQTLGFPISGVLFGLWAADYYYRKDAYKKRYRDVAVSVYTTWLLIVGVELIRKHIATAKTSVNGMKPTTDEEHGHKLAAHSEIEAGHTAAELTIKMAYMALTNLELFSEEAVKTGKQKFDTNELEAGIRQQIVPGAGENTAGETATNNENGGKGNG